MKKHNTDPYHLKKSFSINKIDKDAIKSDNITVSFFVQDIINNKVVISTKDITGDHIFTMSSCKINKCLYLPFKLNIIIQNKSYKTLFIKQHVDNSTNICVLLRNILVLQIIMTCDMQEVTRHILCNNIIHSHIIDNYDNMGYFIDTLLIDNKLWSVVDTVIHTLLYVPNDKRIVLRETNVYTNILLKCMSCLSYDYLVKVISKFNELSIKNPISFCKKFIKFLLSYDKVPCGLSIIINKVTEKCYGCNLDGNIICGVLLFLRWMLPKVISVDVNKIVAVKILNKLSIFSVFVEEPIVGANKFIESYYDKIKAYYHKIRVATYDDYNVVIVSGDIYDDIGLFITHNMDYYKSVMSDDYFVRAHKKNMSLPTLLK